MNDLALVQLLTTCPPRACDAVPVLAWKIARLAQELPRTDAVAGVLASHSTLATRPEPTRIVSEQADPAIEDVLAGWESDARLTLQLP